METQALLNSKEVQELCGLSRSSIYRLRKKGGFPEPVNLLEGKNLWRSGDIQNWIQGLVCSEEKEK